MMRALSRQVPMVVLATLTVTLAGSIALELLAGETPDLSLHAVPATGGVRLSKQEIAGPSVSEIAHRVEIILARPLFAPGRRPDPAAQQAGDDSLPRLTGVSLSVDGKFALFASPGSGRAIVVPEGGRIAGRVVSAIETDTVTVVGSDGRHIVRLAFDPSVRAKQVIQRQGRSASVATATNPR
jgi:hypothetical protein